MTVSDERPNSTAEIALLREELADIRERAEYYESERDKLRERCARLEAVVKAEGVYRLAAASAAVCPDCAENADDLQDATLDAFGEVTDTRDALQSGDLDLSHESPSVRQGASIVSPERSNG